MPKQTILKCFFILNALTMSCLFIWNIALAENAGNEEIIPGLGWGNSIESRNLYMPSQKTDAIPGKVGIVDSDSQYSYDFKAFGKLPMELSLEHEYIGIDNSTPLELPAHLVGLSTDVQVTLPFFNIAKTYFRIGVSPSFLGDDWDIRASTFRIPSRYYAIYKPDEKWIFVAGVAYYPEFQYDFMPIIGFIYKPNNKWTFRLVPKNPNISYNINEKLALFIEGGSSFNEFEVTKDELKHVILKYREIHLGTGVRYKINNFMQASISAGEVFDRELEYKESLGKVDIKNGAYIGFRLEAGL